MAAGGHFLDPIAQQSLGGPLQRRPQDAVVGTPEHLQRLGRKRSAAAGEATGAGEAGQGPVPAGAGQVQRGDLQLRRTHIPVRIREGAAAEAAPHTGQGQETHPKGIEQGRQRHRAAGEAGRGQQQQPGDPLRAAPRQLHRHRSTHRGADQPQRPLALALGDGRQQQLEMTQHRSGAVLGLAGPRTEAKAVEIGHIEAVVGGQQRRQPTKLQMGAVEAVQQQQRRPLTDDRHRPGVGQVRQRPPLHGSGKIAAEGVEQAGGSLLQKLPGGEGCGAVTRSADGWGADGGLLRIAAGAWGQRHERTHSAEVLTRAASSSAGPTAKGRRCRSEPR